jgi:hypothetical protein
MRETGVSGSDLKCIHFVISITFFFSSTFCADNFSFDPENKNTNNGETFGG